MARTCRTASAACSTSPRSTSSAGATTASRRYNDLRRAFGLPPKTSFRAITGEASESFPRDPLINQSDPIDDPNILDFTSLKDANGRVIDPNSPEAETDVVTGVRRSPLAARLKAIYGDVSKVDAFVGMVSEPHIRGTEMGELQLAMWKAQFKALRDGDRFFYQNDPALASSAACSTSTSTTRSREIISLNT